MKKSKKQFLKLPEYPGGKEALRKYIKQNLRYPEEARSKRVEGTVQLNAEIDDNGNLLDIIVEKSVGFGCDEEAIRLLKNVQFGKVKNRGVRVKTRKKFKIHFELPPQKNIHYVVSDIKKQAPKKTDSTKYSYTINLKR